MKIRLTLMLLLSMGVAFSQNTLAYHNKYSNYQEALSLYNASQYRMAQRIFVNTKANTDEQEIKDNCSYYIASCSLKSNESNSEKLMLEFSSQFAISPKRFDAYYDLGQYYFMKNDFKKALVWYKQAEASDKFSQTPTFNFRIGYCYFDQGKYIDAKKHLSRLKGNDTYQSKALYYLGFIAYESNDYQTAKKYFDKIRNDEFAHDRLTYYDSYMSFVSQEYEQAIEQGIEDLYKAKDSTEVSEINKIIGESYFKLQKYRECTEFLSNYKGKWRNTDYYQLGYAYYKQQNYEEAIRYFNKIIGEKSKLTQNAYYHLGECYFRLGEKIKAFNAMTEASRMDFSKQIQSDAWLNRARLSYDIGNLHQSRVVVLDSFVKKYPDSPYKIEIGKLLANALLSSNNFDEALKVIKGNWTLYGDSSLYRKLNYYKGINLFKNASYLESIHYFKAASVGAIDKFYYFSSKYYIGEAYFQGGDYNEALDSFRELKIDSDFQDTHLSELIDYSIGYCYFKLKHFGDAQSYFQAFTESFPNNDYYTDALTRLADCMVANGEFEVAIDNYNQAVVMEGYSHTDYISLESARCLGYMGKDEEKIEKLYSFVNTFLQSEYLDDAYMEIGDTFHRLRHYQKALNAYEDLKLHIPYSPLYPNALLKQATVYKAIHEPYKAIELYKKIVSDFPRTRESIEAVGLAKSTYINQNDLKSYANWVRKIDFDATIDYSVEIQGFKNAKKQYLSSGNTQSLEAYIYAYPKGIYINEARYIVAQNKFDKDPEDATDYFKAIIHDKPSRFTEGSLYLLGKYYFDRDNYPPAMEYLTRLINESKIPAHAIYAYLKTAHIAYSSEQYKEAEAKVEKSMELIKGEENREEAQLILGKVYLRTDREMKGMKYIRELLESKQPQIAGEAHYQKAYYQFVNNAYENSNKTIFILNNKFPQLRELCGRGLLLSARNYISLGDQFQAAFTLESVISSYGEYDHLSSEAIEYLKILKHR